MPEPGWKAPEEAQRYLRVIDVLVPGRREMLRMVASLVASFTGDRPRVLDLGCGPGDVAAAVLRVRPEATLHLVDFSEEMIRLSAERFRGNTRVHLLRHDLNAELPPAFVARGFDIVVSCIALHHLAYDRRVPLYTALCRLLAPGGLFVNGDRFTGESPSLTEWEFDGWIRFMVRRIREKLGTRRTFAQVKQHQCDIDQRMGDQPGTVWEMQQDLRTAGFSSVDCLWKRGHLAVLAATR